MLKVISIMMWFITFGLIYGTLSGFQHTAECFISGRYIEGLITVVAILVSSITALFTFTIACISWTYNKHPKNKIYDVKDIRIIKHNTDGSKEVIKERENDK